MEWIALLLLGLGTGVFGILVGAGGGFILGPILLIFFESDPEVVAGTTIMLVAINTLSGSIPYFRMKLADYRSVLLFGGAGIPGAIIAPFLIPELGGEYFRILFGIMLLSLAVYMVIARKLADSAHENGDVRHGGTTGFMVGSRDIVTAKGAVYHYEFNEAIALAFNFLLGFIASFFGVGAGFLRTPALIYAFRFPVPIAVATSIMTLTIISVAGSSTHLARGNIDWSILSAAGVGLVIGGQIGARLSTRVNEEWVVRLLLLVVLALGIQLIVDGFRG